MSSVKKRFRDYGLSTGLLETGANNLISDVDGVSVGHYTVRNLNIHTGITLIDPGTDSLFRNKLPAAIAIGNGFGKLAGFSQVEELGTLETPIALTNTLAVGPVIRGIVDLTIHNTPDIAPFETINALVGETNDGLINTIHADIIKPKHVKAAYENRSTHFELGCVGAGTGTRSFSWKGGIGSASRLVRVGAQTYTIGAFVQTNFGGALTILGVPIGTLLDKTDFDTFIAKPDGSCMIVLATDAPLSALQLKRVAKRGLLGMVRTGSIMAEGSGDYAIAFTTKRTAEEFSGSDLNQLFLAAVEAVEESIYDALFLATTTVGRDGNVLEALPVDTILELLRARGIYDH